MQPLVFHNVPSLRISLFISLVSPIFGCIVLQSHGASPQKNSARYIGSKTRDIDFACIGRVDQVGMAQ